MFKIKARLIILVLWNYISEISRKNFSREESSPNIFRALMFMEQYKWWGAISYANCGMMFSCFAFATNTWSKAHNHFLSVLSGSRMYSVKDTSPRTGYARTMGIVIERHPRLVVECSRYATGVSNRKKGANNRTVTASPLRAFRPMNHKVVEETTSPRVKQMYTLGTIECSAQRVTPRVHLPPFFGSPGRNDSCAARRVTWSAR